MSRTRALAVPLLLAATALAGCADSPAKKNAVPLDELLSGAHLQIVANAAFPLNVAAQSPTATFAIERTPFDHRDWVIEGIDPIPSELPADLDGATVRWTMEREGDEAPVSQVMGATFTFEFPRGGAYVLHADIVDLEAGDLIESTSGLAPTFWYDAFSVSPEPGLGQTVPVAAFPVEAGPSEGVVRIEREMLEDTNPDPGVVRILRPDGSVAQEKGGGREILFEPDVAGEWRIEWDTGKATALDRVRIELRVQYQDLLGHAGDDH